MKKTLVILLALMLVAIMPITALAGNGETKVSVDVDTSNLSASVPLTMAITAPVGGGGCTEPTNYALSNTGAIAVQVTSVAVADVAGGLTLVTTEPTTAATDVDKISIKLTAGASNVQLNPAAAVTTDLTGFNTAAGSIVAPTNTNIAIEAVCGQLSSTTTQTDAFTITFTIAAQ